MRRVQSGPRNRALAAILIGFVGIGAVPLTAYAAPPATKSAAPKPATPAPTAKKTGKPGDKADDPSRAEARKAYSEAEAKFQAGDYQAAYAAYKAANDAVPAPMTLYKMALSLDKLDRPADALSAYNAFLDSSPPASLDAKVSEVRARVVELKAKMPVVVKVTSDPAGASVELDGAPQPAVTPLELKVAPGHHVLRVASSGFETFEKPLDVQAGAANTNVEAVLTRTPPPPPPAPAVMAAPAPQPPPAPPPEPRSKTAAYVVLGVAGVGAVVGTIFGVKALQDKSDFDDGMNTTEKADSAEKNALIADMAFGAAITLGVTGTVLLLTNGTTSDRAAAPRPQAFELTPVFTPHRAGAAATLHF